MITKRKPSGAVVHLLLWSCGVTIVPMTTALPAFPGAEGAGAQARGGRGGDVYYVTTLADDGPGSLREGIRTATGPRSILFSVAGNILLASDLTINKPCLTIAGQTAPGDGITLQGRQVAVQNCHDVVVRFLRVRPGDLGCPEFQGDAFHFYQATNCIADHLSASWSIDEVLSCTHSDRITVQWCLVTEALNGACHVKGEHGYGSLIRYGAGGLTFHHNLYAAHKARNPLLGDGLTLDFVNNVIYNWGRTAGHNVAEDPSTNRLNYVGNFLVAGPATSRNQTLAFDSNVTHAHQCEVYQSDNAIDSNQDGTLNARNTAWAMFDPPYTQRAVRHPLPPVTTDFPRVAFERVVVLAGARAPRDPVDARVVRDVLAQTGSIIDSQEDVGGFPPLTAREAPADSDRDGVPDDWEEAVGWDPAVQNHNHTNTDGYTDLEWYLNWMAGFHAVCEHNGFVDLDLRRWTVGLTNVNFTVADATNGTVWLSSDGHTARFVSAPNFRGLAGFTFNPSRFGPAFGIGPVPVRMLVAATNTSRVAPMLNFLQPTHQAVIPAGAEIELAAGVAEGSGTVTNVRFYAGTVEPLTLIGERDAAPYRLSWTTPLAGGHYTLRAVARDDQGLSAVDTIEVDVNPVVLIVSTASGAGADVEMREQYDDSANAAALNTRTSDNGDRNEVIGLRFDLEGHVLAGLTNVTLNLTSYRNDTGTRRVNLYGVAPNTAAPQSGFTTGNWDETALAHFGSLPGLLATDGNYLTQSLNTNRLTFLGQITVPANSGEGTLRTFDQAALTAFVREYPGGDRLTFLLAAGDGSSGQFRVASKEATELATPGAFTGPPGTFAPYLGFVVVGTGSRPVLHYAGTDGGAGLRLSWMGPFRLQHHAGPLGTNWLAYPDTNNPVIVPVEPAGPAAWFRLSSEM